MRGKDLLRELQRTVDELAVLNEIGKALTSSLDIGEVMHVILAKVSELLKPSNWSLLLKDPVTEELYFHAADLRILGTVAEFSAIAIENARNFHKVQELTVLDDHTGLFNSRHLKRSLEQEIMRATRFGHPVSVIFFDLDYFKRVNDTHGHQAGSQVLHEIGKLLLKTLRSTDVPVRYGGDEFVMLMPETSKDQAVAAARRLGSEIARQPFLRDRPYGPGKLTASLGGAAFPGDARDPASLILPPDEGGDR